MDRVTPSGDRRLDPGGVGMDTQAQAERKGQT